MCTSLTLTAADGTTLLGRTMDFPNVDPWVPTALPAKTPWRPYYGEQQQTAYRITGAARHLNGHYLFGDGLNSAGLACAELYFPNRVHYYDEPQPAMTNLTPQDFILWVLSNHATIAEVEADLPNIALISHIWFAENKVYPFHWLLADATGRTAVLEPTTLTLSLLADPVHVLTNTPELADHVQRLTDYLGTDHLEDGATAKISSNAPLPEGPIPTNRFIRTAINLLGHPTPLTGKEATDEIVTSLQQVVIPRKGTGNHPANHNFTHYISVLDTTHLTYLHLPVPEMTPQLLTI